MIQELEWWIKMMQYDAYNVAFYCSRSFHIISNSTLLITYYKY